MDIPTVMGIWRVDFVVYHLSVATQLRSASAKGLPADSTGMMH
jgi:hypothetical protein